MYSLPVRNWFDKPGLRPVCTVLYQYIVNANWLGEKKNCYTDNVSITSYDEGGKGKEICKIAALAKGGFFILE